MKAKYPKVVLRICALYAGKLKIGVGKTLCDKLKTHYTYATFRIFIDFRWHDRTEIGPKNKSFACCVFVYITGACAKPFQISAA